MTTTVAEYQVQLAKTMTEKALQNQFDALTDALGWRSYHTHDSRRSPGGFPDSCLVHARQRRLLFVELKTMGGKTSTKQDEWITDLAAAGVEVHVLRPIDLLDGSIEALLRRRTP
jgi:hypothetical protein